MTAADTGHDGSGYDPPRVEDLGRLEVLTQARSNRGNLDGGIGGSRRS